jgi:hypothetical protein
MILPRSIAAVLAATTKKKKFKTILVLPRLSVLLGMKISIVAPRAKEKAIQKGARVQ